MNDKKTELIKCGFRACGAYAVLSFLWLAFVAMGMSAVSSGSAVSVADNSAFASRLIENNLAIALYSAVYGFSFLVLQAKKLSSAAKRSLHILMNYVASMVCVYLLHAGTSNVKASAWIILLFFATMIFFVIYGIATFVSYLIKRNK